MGSIKCSVTDKKISRKQLTKIFENLIISKPGDADLVRKPHPDDDEQRIRRYPRRDVRITAAIQGCPPRRAARKHIISSASASRFPHGNHTTRVARTNLVRFTSPPSPGKKHAIHRAIFIE